MAGFFGKQPFGEAARQLKRHALTAGQTTINVTYVRGFLDLYLNGVLLAEGSDYTATDGVTAVLASGAAAGDVAHTVSWGTFASADHYTKADSDALHLTALAGRKNYLINGCMRVWQRGASLNTVNGYTADRWKYLTDTGGGGTYTQSRQTFALGQTDVPGNPEFFLRADISGTAPTGQTVSRVVQRIEGVRTLAGTTVTISFYLKADTARNFDVNLAQYFGSGGTPSSTVVTAAGTAAATTAWSKYTISVALPSISGKTLGTDGNDFLELRIDCPLNSLWTLDLAQFQLEAGPLATEFEHRPIGEELALAQRYTKRIKSDSAYTAFATGVLHSATLAVIHLPFGVTMRGKPGITTGGAFGLNTGGGSLGVSSFGAQNIGVDSAYMEIATSGGTTGQAVVLRAGNDVNAYIHLDAEL